MWELRDTRRSAHIHCYHILLPVLRSRNNLTRSHPLYSVAAMCQYIYLKESRYSCTELLETINSLLRSSLKTLKVIKLWKKFPGSSNFIWASSWKLDLTTGPVAKYYTSFLPRVVRCCCLWCQHQSTATALRWPRWHSTDLTHHN